MRGERGPAGEVSKLWRPPLAASWSAIHAIEIAMLASEWWPAINFLCYLANEILWHTLGARYSPDLGMLCM